MGSNVSNLWASVLLFAFADSALSCHMFYPQRVVDIKDEKPKLEKLDNDEKKEMPKDIW